MLLFAFVSANGPLSFQQSPPLQSKTNSDDVSLHRYCFSGPKSRVALCRCLRTAIVSAGRSRALLCADVCGLLLFQRSEVAHCSVQMSADCYCFSCPESSVALCRCLRTAIVSAVQSRALRCADVMRCGLLLFQQAEIEHCSVQMSALCRCLRTAIVSAVRNRAFLCADVCGLLLFQRSEVARCAVQMSADCYCFSCPKSSVARCRCLRTAIVSAVRNRALLYADVCGLLLL